MTGEPGLLPGLLLRFDGGEEPAYGEVLDVEAVDPVADRQSWLVSIKLLCGKPALATQTVTVLSDDQMAREVQRLQGAPENPLSLGDVFTGEFLKLGALTLVDGDDFVLKYETLSLLVDAVKPYQRLLIVDPLGLFSPGDPVGYRRAGDDVRLSLQSVGGKRFLEAFGQMFPEGLAEAAVGAVGERLPELMEFVPFSRLLNVDAAGFPLKNLVTQNYRAMMRTGLFAETPEQVFALPQLLTDIVNVIDVSALSEPWKSLFYEEACHEVFRNAGGDVMPVLIYPEHYLRDLETWVQKADEAELNLLVMASPYAPGDLHVLANNLVTAESRERIHLEGELTAGLPVILSLPEGGPQGSPVEAGRQAGPPDTGALPEAAPQEAAFPSDVPEAPAEQTPVSSPPPLPVIDLSAPPPEPGLPVTLPEADETPMAPPSPAQAPYFSAEPETPQPPLPEEASQPLDYPDADEGAISPEQPESAEQAGEAPPFPGTAEWEQDEFSFDVNLDRKSQAEWDAEWQAAEVGELAAQTGLPENAGDFEAFTQPVEPPGAEPGTVYGSAPEPMAYDAPLADELTFADETMGGTPADEAPVPVMAKPRAALDVPNPGGFQPGDRVRHETYGLGVVNKVIPMEDNVVLNITFEDVGKRLLDPSLCRLTRESG